MSIRIPRIAGTFSNTPEEHQTNETACSVLRPPYHPFSVSTIVPLYPSLLRSGGSFNTICAIYGRETASIHTHTHTHIRICARVSMYPDTRIVYNITFTVHVPISSMIHCSEAAQRQIRTLLVDHLILYHLTI